MSNLTYRGRDEWGRKIYVEEDSGWGWLIVLLLLLMTGTLDPVIRSIFG
jgi:hypothetical protein